MRASTAEDRKNWDEKQWMGYRNKQKGYRREQRLMKKYRNLGWIALRSAGSHSPFDVIAIHPQLKQIKLFQCKGGKSYSENFLKKMKESMKFYDGTYEVKGDVQ